MPIELWYLGKRELDGPCIDLVKSYNVRCVNAYEVRSRNPARILNGWELNPYSVLHSSFKEVLFLDADNLPVKDPTYLFDENEYKRTGSI